MGLIGCCMALLASRFLTHGLRTTLIATTNQKQVFVSLKTLVPHLLWRVAAATVALLPGHAAFRSIEVVACVLRTISRSESHVGGDVGSAVSVLP